MTQRLLRTLHNLPVATSVLTRRVDGPTSDVVSGLLRAAPPPVRAATSRVAGSRSPAVAALAAAAAGEGRSARELLRAAVEGEDGTAASPARLQRLLAAAVTLHEPDLARAALDRLPAADARYDWCAALVAAEEGHLGEAVRLLDAGRVRDSTRVRRLRRRLRAQLEVLHPTLPARPARRPALRAGGPRTVLHVVKNALPEVQAGYTLRTHGLARAQADAGSAVHVVSRLGFPVDIGHPDAAERVDLDGVTYHRLLPTGSLPAAGAPTLARTAREVRALATEVGADVVHAHSDHPQAQAAIRAARGLGLPVVYEVRGMLEQTWVSRGGDPDSDLVRWSRSAETACMLAADAVVVLSEAMRADVEARGVPADRVTIVPNAVGPGVLASLDAAEGADAGAASRAAVRGRLGIDPDTVLVGCVSTLNDYEGLDVLVEALARVEAGAGDGADLRLLVVGGGPALDGLRGLVEDLGLSDRVVLTGTIPHAQVAEHLLALDVVAVPRRSTPVTRLVPPLKPLEAFAAGRPVLASDLPPLRETLTEACGTAAARWLVTPDDVVAWAEALSGLRYARADIRGDGAAARAWVRDARTWPQVGRAYARVYASAGRPGARPDDTGSRPTIP